MTALDNDVFTLYQVGQPAVEGRVAALPPADRALPVVVVEEALRGRLNGVRQAQAGRGRLTVTAAYDLLAGTVETVHEFRILSYTPQADALFQQWRTSIRIGPRDLRIAAICVSLSVTLATRNARDFNQVPGLALDIWP